MADDLDIKSAIRTVVEGGTLDAELAAAAMDQIMTGAVTPAQIGALVTALRMRGEIEPPEAKGDHLGKHLRPSHQLLFFVLGFGALLSVPIFKTVTHLPPFMGMMFALSVMWIVAEIVKHGVHESLRSTTQMDAVSSSLSGFLSAATCSSSCAS